MLVFCENCDLRWAIVCDFCKFYYYNGQWVISKNDILRNVYTEDGFCILSGMPEDPHDGCIDFHCFKATNKDVAIAIANEGGES